MTDSVATRLEEACSRNPNDASAWRALGGYHASLRQLVPARKALERAVALAPNDDESVSLLGWVMNEQGESRQALAVLNPENAQRPVSLNRLLRFSLLLPYVYESGEALDWWRRRYSQNLESIAADPLRFCPDPRHVVALNQSNFLLAYQGGNDLALQRQYAGIIGTLLEKAYPEFVEPIRQGSGGTRIRVAFVSSFLHACTIGHYFRSWIETLPTSDFETVVIYTGTTPDATTKAIGSRAGRYLALNGNALEVAKAIREVRPDILVYPEVGMHSKNYLLANMRLAPVQCAAWGHPVTTGSARIDYYLSCAEMEPDNAAEHYAERLLLLPGIGTRYAMPETGSGPITRADIGIQGHGHVYLCPQSLFKVHPDNDDLLLQILERDEKAVLVFFQDRSNAITLAFANRLAGAMAARGIPQRKQIKFLPFTTPELFRRIASLADVVLDTLHWSGGNTSLDVLSVGAPVVTLPGAFMRGRQSMGMLRRLGVPELIADSGVAYVELALRVASNPDEREVLSRRILSGRAALFDREEPVHALGEHLKTIHRSGAA